ncbi:hypothetical protein A3J90_05585 [candidate division WOR-1 bacterium RIFOXYC2_FULL_37_10]|uniref:Excinuclease ABC subunit C n=1 Tax=candidate division WOR-1 bacterium RIFOXYB2_FULL_37_13 TaxID=1802579 RepID=A0A1F4SDV6_UNCSA|nr:MAG: hypothetical protein A2246_05395 [candidate division WOR-1 bacterium RIFOXYA2_FULL_37_7]OGC18577.1 MAG: hypothetical protein A2310_02075 [candidate division WOR-1 bacterium RIFOXYB2_FULL_37_13]OGC37110.1 MAG: hypothetical protein A3J90_05585 [candidate division WOR-1 bacterium RIFOXYC2_FULL_37_10]
MPRHKAFPPLPGVYLFKDANGQAIYVGKAKSLKNRLASYFQKNIESPKTRSLIDHYKTVEYIVTPSELEALLLEQKLIKKFKPKYNVQWRDDKRYPYLKLSINEDWPKLFLVRERENDGALYFGPYEAGSVRETIKLIGKLFLLRKCKASPLKKRKQPCLNFYMKRCLGPCTGTVSSEEYKNIVLAVAALLDGNLDETISNLEKEMQKAAKNEDFEKAAYIRNKINKIKKIHRTKPSWMPHIKAIKYEPALKELKKVLRLNKKPYRIEGFDVSNTQGAEIVASMVVFVRGELHKEDYRKFIIKTVTGPNDVASIYEVVYRRYAGTLKEKLPLPDLILIDGGKGQVESAYKAMKKAGAEIPLISLAKKEELIYSPGIEKPLKLPEVSEALKLLQRIRDESHRFAINFHRKRRGRFF